MFGHRSKMNSMGTWYEPWFLCFSPVMRATHILQPAGVLELTEHFFREMTFKPHKDSKVSEGWEGERARLIKPRGTYDLTRLTRAVENSGPAWVTGEGCQLSSLGFAITPHERKALESLAWNCNKAFWKMIVSLMIISLTPLREGTSHSFCCC